MYNAPLLNSTEDTVGTLIEALIAKRDALTAIEQQAKALKKEEDALKFKLMAAMEEQGTKSVSNERGAVRINAYTVPDVTDWNAVCDYIRKTDSFHLLPGKLAAIPYREVLESGEEIPGVVPFIRKTLTLTVKH